MSSVITESAVREALSRVEDPEIGRPITELNMVKSVTVTGNDVAVEIYLTIAGCPMKSTIESNTRAAVEDIEGVGNVTVTMEAMSDEQRRELKKKLRGGQAEPEIPFAKPDSTTRVFAVASGKGGVGKSSMTVNLAAALVQKGLKVGIVDADIYGHSVPNLLGCTDGPTVLDDEMLLPPISHGIKHISIGQFVEGNAPVVWRGPMLHRALQQFLADVLGRPRRPAFGSATGHWRRRPVRSPAHSQCRATHCHYPQAAAAEVAERAGSISQQTRQRVAGVIENMGAMVMPDGSTMDVFGTGGGQIVADRLGVILGHEVPLLASVPLDPTLRSGGDAGTPIVLDSPSPRRPADPGGGR